MIAMKCHGKLQPETFDNTRCIGSYNQIIKESETDRYVQL